MKKTILLTMLLSSSFCVHSFCADAAAGTASPAAVTPAEVLGAAASPDNATKTSTDAAGAGTAAASSPKVLNEMFLQKAEEINLAEIKMGEMAKSKGTSDAVKKLGDRLITDHTKNSGELKALAAAEGVKLPVEVPQMKRDKAMELEKKSGAEFDKAFMAMNSEGHAKAVELYQEATKTTDPEIKALASKHLPMIQEHGSMSGGHGAHHSDSGKTSASGAGTSGTGTGTGTGTSGTGTGTGTSGTGTGTGTSGTGTGTGTSGTGTGTGGTGTGTSGTGTGASGVGTGGTGASGTGTLGSEGR